MHHFSKIHKRLWYHIALSLGSALVTVALFDTLSSLSWLCKDYQVVAHYTGAEDSTTPIDIVDIIYWIFVSYRMVLSLVICVGGIFMGRRVIVIVWLLISLIIDLIHLSETIYILSRPNLIHTWPIAVAVTSCIWQELKIIRIKYRIIRRSLLVDTNNNDDDDDEYEPETLKKEIKSHRDSFGKFSLKVHNHEKLASFSGQGEEISNSNHESEKLYDDYGQTKCTLEYAPCQVVSRRESALSRYIATNAIHFIKLVRNLYNLLTWHFTGYLFGGDYLHLMSTNEKAMLLEQSFVQYARIFLDALTEKRLLLTPWIMAYIMTVSASIAIFLFTLLHLNLLTTLFASIYYLVFAIDLFFRCGFLLFCIRYILETKKMV